VSSNLQNRKSYIPKEAVLLPNGTAFFIGRQDLGVHTALTQVAAKIFQQTFSYPEIFNTFVT
jgi:hypothetical protein